MAIKFRVDGEELTVDYDKMHQWLGFPRNGFASKSKGWNATSIWEMLTGQSTFTPRNAGNKWIKDESILYLHKYLCYALFGRVEASKVQTRDLFVLESILQGKQMDIAGMVLDTIYNASRHQGKVTLGVGSMAPILAYAARMPIPPYQPQPTDIFRYMDGAFLKKTSLVEEVKTSTTVLYRWKPWERRVGHSDRDEGTSDAQTQRQRKGKPPVSSSSHTEEEEDEVAGWKQVLGCFRPNEIPNPGRTSKNSFLFELLKMVLKPFGITVPINRSYKIFESPPIISAMGPFPIYFIKVTSFNPILFKAYYLEKLVRRTNEVLGKGIGYVGPLETDARKIGLFLTYDF
ncbi:hypothetical protein JCGZ_10992 [Jatropha curcas]|uniref:Arabidopsis retrotransposon Orf1 C-terminal domain-containing protein n=1 Tax=Jatropha curcas TaxID=180498 RepID=A0A067KGJ7_JATCU|nr:hypothetical protein JCGZ_10992 [Jatropha curcas]